MPERWTISLGASAEKLAGIYGISRERAGRVRTAQPPTRARQPGTTGSTTQWVVPVPGTELERDENIRADTTLERLGQLEAGVRRRWDRHGGKLPPRSTTAPGALLLADEVGR